MSVRIGETIISGNPSSGGSNEWNSFSVTSQSFSSKILELTCATTGMNKGNRIKFTDGGTIKYGIVVGLTSTTLSVFTGNYEISNASDFSYSSMYSPEGFPVNKNNWKIEITDNEIRYVTSPSKSTIYNLGNISITLPKGDWDLSYQICYQCGTAATANGAKYMTVGLGETTTSFDTTLTTAIAGYSNFVRDTTTKPCGVISLDGSKTYYFNERNDGVEASAGLGMPIYILNSEAQLIIKAVSIYV